MEDKAKKKALKKCKRCENFKPEKCDCIYMEIAECKPEDIEKCKYYLAKSSHVFF